MLVIQERHKRFFENAGHTAPETRKARKNNRKSFCWSCKQPVDNSIDLECSACGWIICGYCGACRCNHGENAITYQSHETRVELPPHNELKTKKEGIVFKSFKEASHYAKDNPGLKLMRTDDRNAWKVE